MGSGNVRNDFLNFLESNGMVYDEPSNSYRIQNNQQTVAFPNSRSDLITSSFQDLLYKDLNMEINITWKLGLFSSTLILARKYIENLVIDVLRKKYPPSTVKKKKFINLFQQRSASFPCFFSFVREFGKKKEVFSLTRNRN